MIQKKYYSLLVLVISFLLSTFSGYAQTKPEITEGKDYWLAIPHCKHAQDEPVRWGTYPVELWVSSKVNTTCKVVSADGTMNDNYAIRANEIKVIAISDVLMNTVSEVVTNKGIRTLQKMRFLLVYLWLTNGLAKLTV